MTRSALASLLLLAACGTYRIQSPARPTAQYPQAWNEADPPAPEGKAPPSMVAAAAQDDLEQARREAAESRRLARGEEPAPAAFTAPVRSQPDGRARAASGLVAVLDFKNKLRGTDREDVDPAYFANQVRAAV
jgi:hypothetical protein